MPRRAVFAVLATVAMSVACEGGCREPEGVVGPNGRCGDDEQCPRGQTCDGGLCVERTDAAADGSPESASADRPAGVRGTPILAEPRAWSRGGPGLPAPSRFVGPTGEPSVRWEVTVGTPITAAPAVMEFEDGGDRETVAFVGAHSGRFVGVAVDGPRAGTTVLDLRFPGIVWSTAAVGPHGRLHVGTDADTLITVDPVRGEVVGSLRVGTCTPPRALGPVGHRCDVDGGPTVHGGELYVGADAVYRLSMAASGEPPEILWRFTGEPPPEPEADSDAEDASEKKKSKKKKSKKKKKKSKKKSKKKKKKKKKDKDEGAGFAAARIDHVYAAPLVTPAGDVVAATQGAGLIKIGADGVERWRLELEGDVDGAPALGRDGTIFVGDDGGRLSAVSADGALRWTHRFAGPIRAAVAIDDARNRVYVTTLGGELCAMDRRTGALLWTFEIEAPTQSAPLVDAAGTVYFAARDGVVYAVSRRGRERWSLQLPAPIGGALALARDGALVFGADDGMLRAVADTTAPARGTDNSGA